MAKRELIDKQDLLQSLDNFDWQELYLPIHFKDNVIDDVPTITEQEIVKPYFSALADNVNKLAKVCYDGKVYVPINDVFDLISNLLSE